MVTFPKKMIRCEEEEEEAEDDEENEDEDDKRTDVSQEATRCEQHRECKAEEK